jgi:hypothetical protein
VLVELLIRPATRSAFSAQCLADNASLYVEQQNVGSVLRHAGECDDASLGQRAEVQMVSFLFQCPQTGYLVKATAERRDAQTSVRCDACKERHIIDRETGEVVGQLYSKFRTSELRRRFA